MLSSEKELRGYSILARDGEIGKVHEFFFDDVSWQIRYLVANVGPWLVGRLLLVAADFIGDVDGESGRLTVDLTCEQVEECRSVEPVPPAALHRERELQAHHDWPVFWTTGNPMVSAVLPHEAPGEKRSEAERLGDPHLHGTREVSGYRVRTADGEAGQVADLMIDSQGWEIPHLVLNLGNWLPGKKVLVPTAEIIETRRDELAISVELSQTEIENSPVFDAARLDFGQDTETSGTADDG